MKHQRQVGFIRNYSSKQLSTFQQEPSEFSYFRPRQVQDQKDEFSPYKIDDEPPKNKLPIRPPLPQKPRESKALVTVKAQGQEIYSRLKQRMNSYEQRKDKSKQKLQTNIGSIRTKIGQLDKELQELKSKSIEKISSSAKIQQQFEPDPQSSSSSSSSESEEVVVNSIPSPKLSIQKYRQIQKSQTHSNQLRQSGNKQTNRLESQHQDSYSVRENVITFNSRISNQPPLQIKNYSSSSEEEEVHQQSQESNYFIEKKREIAVKIEESNHATQSRQSKKELYQNKGGICFDIDTKQFTEPVIKPRQERPAPKKVVKVDKNTQIIRRRETAKAYDKMARKALFTPYH